MEKEIILTREGLQNLEEELENLKGTKRMEIAERIKQAISFGDLSENSEYDDAKNEQAAIEMRIVTIENMLKNAKVIDEDELTTENVHVGSRIRVLDMEYNEELTYQIVGSAEADPYKGRISDESPLGKSLLGNKAGAVISVEAPGGEIQYKILEITI